jgi:hypothetical protein
VLGAIAEFDKAMTVAKLRGARDRKRKTHGKCEGRNSLAEMHPAVVREAKRLGRASPKSGERRSLRKIAAELAKIGGQTRGDLRRFVARISRPTHCRRGSCQPASAEHLYRLLSPAL